MPQIRFSLKSDTDDVVADLAPFASSSALIQALVSDGADTEADAEVCVDLDAIGHDGLDEATVHAMVALASQDAGPTWDLSVPQLGQLVKLCQFLGAPTLCATAIRTLAHRINTLRPGSEDERALRGERA